MATKRRSTRNNTSMPINDKAQSGDKGPDAGSLSNKHHTLTASVDRNAKGNGHMHWLEYATAAFAFVAAIGSASSVVVGYWQWSTMRGQLIAMQSDQRHTSRLQANQSTYLCTNY